jgi:TldD protein
VTRLIRIAVLGLCASFCFAQAPALSAILGEELNRNFQILKEKADPPPYFMSYTVTEQEACSVTATLGALQGSTCSRSRLLDVSLRVGSPVLDNYHRAQGDRPVFTAAVQIPIEDNPAAIRQRLWLETDRIYRLAAERFIKIQTSTQVRLAASDLPPDFTVEKPAAMMDCVSQIPTVALGMSSVIRVPPVQFPGDVYLA